MHIFPSLYRYNNGFSLFPTDDLFHNYYYLFRGVMTTYRNHYEVSRYLRIDPFGQNVVAKEHNCFVEEMTSSLHIDRRASTTYWVIRRKSELLYKWDGNSSLRSIFLLLASIPLWWQKMWNWTTPFSFKLFDSDTNGVVTLSIPFPITLLVYNNSRVALLRYMDNDFRARAG